MDFYHYISELLYDHDCVVVPGLGGFVANYSPARIHPVLHTFSPPRKEILFNARLQSNDGVLAHYVSGKEKITYDEALMQIGQFVQKLMGSIENKRTAEIVKVGILFRDEEGNMQFEPSREVNYLLSSFGLAEFVSPAIQRRVFPSRQDRRRYERPVVHHDRRVPVALKRAIWIGLPVLALLIAGSLSINTLKQVYTQYSDIFPFHGSSKEKTQVDNSRKGIFDDKTYIEPVTLSGKTFSVRHSGEEPEAASDNASSAVVQPAGHKFYIIGNCFLYEENAEKYVRSLKAKGYVNAGYFLPPRKKLFRAYINAFDDRAATEAALKEIREQCSPDAWLLEL